MRDVKDYTTLELPGFDLSALPAPPQVEKRPGLVRNAKVKTATYSQLDLLEPLGESDQTGLPVWCNDPQLDQSGLPVWQST
jgi:hypothetical protein